MQIDSPDRIRNLAVVGHNGTGKTTLVSALLLTSGVATRLNKVEDGNTVTDYDTEEIERTISIGVATAFAPWRRHKVNLIDCPGYGIFQSEIQSGLRVADTALVCVDGASGIEVLTERVWKLAEEMELPVCFHLTRMDRERADLGSVTNAIQKRFGRNALPVQLAIGREADFTALVDLVNEKVLRFEAGGKGTGSEEAISEELADEVREWRTKLVEAVAESDDELMEKFFEEGTLSIDELVVGLRAAIANRQIFPITVGSALRGVGSSALLDTVVDLLPSPMARGTYPATNVAGEDIPVQPDPAGPASALIFKTTNDPTGGRVSFLRVVNGTLQADSTYWNPREESTERLGTLSAMQGKSGASVSAAVCGDIVGVAKLKISNTGDTLCTREQPVRLGWIQLPPPAMSFAAEPKSKGDEEKIGESVRRLMDEDIALKASRDAQTGEFLLSGTGQLHAEITVAKLKTRYKVHVILHPPKVPYREALRKKAEGRGRHKKQSGGRGQFADCTITIEPLPRGEEFEFVDEIFGGSIPQNFRPAVGKGIQESAASGYSTDYPVVDFRVRLQDGQYHDVDSSELAFKIAGSLAFKDAMSRAKPVLIEPVMQVEINTSEEFMGDIMSDLSQRRGKPQGMDSGEDGSQSIKAIVPMAEMLDYAPALRSMTQGRSSFTMAYSHYEELPKLQQDKLIAEYRRAKEASG